jgi:hypothetical protein
LRNGGKKVNTQRNHGAIYDLSPREILYTAGVPAPESVQPYIDDPIYAAGEEPAEYPDIYYMLQAHVLSACDRYEAMYGGVLKKRHLKDLTEALYNDITRIHPDLMGKDYDPNDGSVQPVAAIPAQQFGRGFRSRNFLRDLIEILLLSEFLRRRRRRY